jgi:hypothetical protein
MAKKDNKRMCLNPRCNRIVLENELWCNTTCRNMYHDYMKELNRQMAAGVRIE